MKARIRINDEWHWAELVQQPNEIYGWRDERGNDLNCSSDSWEDAANYLECAFPEGCEIRA